MTQSEQRFIELLEAATRETGVSVGGCGCCHSPWIAGAELDEVTYRGAVYRGGYLAKDNGEELEWTSGYDRCLEAHREEWEIFHHDFWQRPGNERFGKMNTAEFGLLILSGEVPDAQDGERHADSN